MFPRRGKKVMLGGCRVDCGFKKFSGKLVPAV